MKVLLIFFIQFFLNQNLNAQTCDITLNDGKILSHMLIQNLDSNDLVVSNENLQLSTIYIDNILKIKIYKEGGVGKFFLPIVIGAVTGLLIGDLVTKGNDHKILKEEKYISSIGVGIILGTIVTISDNTSDTYDFSPLKLSTKRSILVGIIADN